MWNVQKEIVKGFACSPVGLDFRLQKAFLHMGVVWPALCFKRSSLEYVLRIIVGVKWKSLAARTF